jgi:glycosyltransferase involved in cell wall biosynthesis
MILCNSRFTARSQPKLFPRTRAEVLYCPVAFTEKNYSEEDRLATRAELNTPEDAVVIIQVSRIEEIKGQSVHLRALGALKDVPNWISWQVGSAQRPHEVEHLNNLKRCALELGIAERVRFVDQRVEIRKLLAAADIYCQPNTGPEGFGLTFVESLLAGLPVVTTAIGGACEIVDASCGVLVPPDDIHKLIASLRLLIEDQDKRAYLSSAGPTRAKNLCDPRNQITLLHKLLESI